MAPKKKRTRRNHSKHSVFTIEAVRYIMRRYQEISGKGPYPLLRDIEELLPNKEFRYEHEAPDGSGKRVLCFDVFKTFINERSITPSDDGEFITRLIAFIKRQTVIPEHHKLLSWPATHNLFADSLVKLSAGDLVELRYLEALQREVDIISTYRIACRYSLRHRSMVLMLFRGCRGNQFIQTYLTILDFGITGDEINGIVKDESPYSENAYRSMLKRLCKENISKQVQKLELRGIMVPDLGADVKPRMDNTSDTGTGYFFTENGYNVLLTYKRSFQPSISIHTMSSNSQGSESELSSLNEIMRKEYGLLRVTPCDIEIPELSAFFDRCFSDKAY